jgi:hypothetical protein
MSVETLTFTPAEAAVSRLGSKSTSSEATQFLRLAAIWKHGDDTLPWPLALEVQLITADPFVNHVCSLFYIESRAVHWSTSKPTSLYYR